MPGQFWACWDYPHGTEVLAKVADFDKEIKELVKYGSREHKAILWPMLPVMTSPASLRIWSEDLQQS